MRVFRRKPFFWGTKEVTRYLRSAYSGHDLALRLLVYSVICEIESDFEGKPFTSFAKVIETYSGLKRQVINEVIKDFQKIGVIQVYELSKQKGKFCMKCLTVEDRVPVVPNQDNGQNRLPFSKGDAKTASTDVPISDIGKRYIFKKINNKENNRILSDKSDHSKTSISGLEKANFSRPLPQKSHINGPIQDFADELTDWFGEKEKFAMYCGAIKRNPTKAREVFSVMKEKGNKSGRYFMACLRKVKVESG